MEQVLGTLGYGFGLVKGGFGIGRHECWVVFLFLGRNNFGLRSVRLGFWARWTVLGRGGLGFANVMGFGGLDRLIFGF